jgi:dihydroxyacid dehydratase/phosphogluconate dehydratase
MSEPSILFVRPKAISQRDKKLLREAGILIVEIDDPKNAKFIRAHSELTGSEMLKAALWAINQGGSTNTKLAFSNAICAAIEAQQTPGA